MDSRLIGLLLGIALTLEAQERAPAFEVAAVRRVELTERERRFAPNIRGGPGTNEPGRINYERIPLLALISQAYAVRRDQITGPGWLSTERYNLVANVPAGATGEQLNLMIQTLLRERFHLQFHKEMKIRPTYALVIGKDGPKLKASKGPGEPEAPDQPIGAPDAEGFPMLPPNYRGIVARDPNGIMLLSAADTSLGELMKWLDSDLGRPTTDETGLSGRYDFRLRFESARGDQAARDEPVGTVFSAIEQLGLKLESRNAPFETIVVDSVDKDPSED